MVEAGKNFIKHKRLRDDMPLLSLLCFIEQKISRNIVLLMASATAATPHSTAAKTTTYAARSAAKVADRTRGGCWAVSAAIAGAVN